MKLAEIAMGMRAREAMGRDPSHELAGTLGPEEAALAIPPKWIARRIECLAEALARAQRARRRMERNDIPFDYAEQFGIRQRALVTAATHYRELTAADAEIPPDIAQLYFQEVAP